MRFESSMTLPGFDVGDDVRLLNDSNAANTSPSISSRRIRARPNCTPGLSRAVRQARLAAGRLYGQFEEARSTHGHAYIPDPIELRAVNAIDAEFNRRVQTALATLASTRST